MRRSVLIGCMVVVLCAVVIGIWLWQARYSGFEGSSERLGTLRTELDTSTLKPRSPVEPEALPDDPPLIPDSTTLIPALPDSTIGPQVPTPPPKEDPKVVPTVPLPSGLIIPVAGIKPEDLIDTFEDARSQGRSHDAIDIIAPHRTPVLAAADGTVVRLFNSKNGGITLYQLAPDNRTVYYYAHLDGYAEGIAKDVFVTQGTVLGYVGDTGNAVPGNYHLHFAIWVTDDPKNFWDGVNLNPFPLLGGKR